MGWHGLMDLAFPALQAVAMSCFPRVKVKHTSEHVRGQVFIPTVNWLLMVGCVAVVLIFQTSGKIGNAYGEAAFRTVHAKVFACTKLAAGTPCSTLGVQALQRFFLQTSIACQAGIRCLDA